jgi:hypothetical protein
MTLGGDPTQATFRIRYSATDEGLDITVYGEPGEGSPTPTPNAASWTVAEILTPSGAPAREAWVTVSVATGIYRIEIGTGTGTEAVYLDDITITGAVFEQIN